MLIWGCALVRPLFGTMLPLYARYSRTCATEGGRYMYHITRAVHWLLVEGQTDSLFLEMTAR